MNPTPQRMRGLDAFYEQLKKDDPGTIFSRHSIRALGLQGKIPGCVIGNRRFYNYDAFLHILATDPASLSIDSTEPATAAPLLPVRKLAGRK